jgi:thiamine biosynthesis lipoprotein
MIKKPLYIIICFLFSLVVSACMGRNEQENKYSQRKQLMGTYVQLDTCSSEISRLDAERIYRRVWGRMQDIAWRMNVYDEKSDVTKINHAYPQPVTVQADTYELVKRSLQLNFLTEGAFDITVGPLIDLWRSAQQKNETPQAQDIKLVKQAVGSQNLHTLAENQVQLVHPMTKIDLGGIAKGYALDEAARLFREAGVRNFYLDAGGDIYVGGLNCRGEKWRIGIRDPKNKDELVDVVSLSDAAVTTSGNYEQFFLVRNQKYSHIINPVTGYPQQGVISATVIGPSAAEADALATALTVLGGEKGTELIGRLGRGYASLIILEDRDGPRRFQTENYNLFRLSQS